MLKIISIVILLLLTSNTGLASYSSPPRVKEQHPIEIVGYKPYKNVLDQKELKCLTDNVYFEAGNEKQEGKIAVAVVTLNRIKHKHFPNTICDVVYQRVKWKCQFTWVCFKNKKIKYWSNYFQSKKIAEYVMLNYYHINDPTKGATFFHQIKIKKPFKNEDIVKTVSIGKHVFYKL